MFRPEFPPQDRTDMIDEALRRLMDVNLSQNLALPAQWRGLRDDDLSKESGISGCVFVHMSGFIGGNVTYDGALAI
ncbi:hypothetical protein L2E82_13995 [Cichorium intybus]|uniref:Uncharacterized protein n=1 Tax=Cichorium intybus TaxID=13427 RepID=A0ACB9EYU6_CICIN|nr:hypothetical protein L2E82_13995 [Cichorium intybus]